MGSNIHSGRYLLKKEKITMLKRFLALGCLTKVIILLCLFFFVIIPINRYTLNYWISASAEEVVNVGWWPTAGISLFVGWNIGIVAAIITSICDAADIPEDHPSEKPAGLEAPA
jgi:hypothetical protein